MPVHTSSLYTKGNDGFPPLGQVHSNSPPSLPKAKEGRCELEWSLKSFFKLYLCTEAKWAVTLAVSAISCSPHIAPIQTPKIPSDKQPEPYWYLGPSFSKSSLASSLYFPPTESASAGFETFNPSTCTFWMKNSPLNKSFSKRLRPFSSSSW